MSPLAAAVAAIENFAARDPKVAGFQADMLAFAAAHDDALWRSCLRGHFTGSAMVLDHGGTHVLLMHHAKLDRWLQPGGHADGDGHLARVALREAIEETGVTGLTIDPFPVDLDIHVIPERGEEPEHDHLDVRFLVVAAEGAEPAGNSESNELRWVPVADVDNYGVDAGLIRLVDAAVRRFRTS